MAVFPYLSRPIKLAGVTFKNRIFGAPTSLAELGPHGHLSRANIEYYKLRAAGGCAVVTVGESIVDTATGQSDPMQIALDDPEAVPSLTECADAIHSHGAAAAIELSHGGGMATLEFLKGPGPVKGPSAFIDSEGNHIEEMTVADIEALAAAFGKAAARAKACGFDMVTIHGGHGWMIHQFLSPLTNFRTDEFGGSIENRMRFPLLVVDKVRAAVGPQVPIEFRMSGDERVKGGFDIKTGIEIAKMLDGKVDLIHVSAGNQRDDYSTILMHPGIFQKEGENSGLASEIKKHVKTPVTTVGGFCDPAMMEEFLAAGHADCISLGRALIADPFLPKKIFANRVEDITPCIRCGECQSNMFASRNMRCTVNPIVGREIDFFHPLPTRAKKKVLIAGGGPSGMQAAITAYERGHGVVLCEAGSKLGGALKYADSADFKAAMLHYRESQIKKVLALPIDIRLNTKVDAAVVAAVKPDVLIAAIGADPIVLPVPGADGPNVVIGSDLEKNTKLGGRVVIIGGGLVGCEDGVHLAREGHHVVILEMRGELAADSGLMHKINLLHQVETEPNIVPATGLRCTGISSEGVTAVDEKGGERFFPADSVIMAAGMRAKSAEVEALRPLVSAFYVIGDALRARKVMNAVRDGYDAIVDMGLE